MTRLQNIFGQLLLTSIALMTLYAETAQSALIFGASGGLGVGTLKRVSLEKTAGNIAQGYVGYAKYGIGMHGYVQHISLDYKVGEDAYTGVSTQYGLGAKLNGIRSKVGQVTALLQLPLSTSFTVVSESTGLVQNLPYSYSTLITLSGGSGYQILAGYEFMSLGRFDTRYGNKTYLGIYVSWLSQTFTKQSTRIKTNNSELAPISPGTESVDYSSSFMALLLSFSFTM